jgi:hypothetical protein
MNTIQIFIASSEELKDDREAFRNFLSVENDLLHKKGVYLELVQWEHFLDAVSHTRLQDEYNKKLKASSIVVCLFYTRAGKYTQEEFDTALRQFRDTGSPMIYTYFKTGAPTAHPGDESTQDLLKFKKRLEDIGHFYTSYDSIADLKFHFRKQLDRLGDMGFIAMRDDLTRQTKEVVANYFNFTNTVQGNNNVIIQGVTAGSISVVVDGKSQEILNKLDALQAFLGKLNVTTFQTGDKTYDIETINNANLSYSLGHSISHDILPDELLQNLITDRNRWVQSLRQELIRRGVAVGDRPNAIFQHFGWLIEAFLQKIESPSGRELTIRRLSFLAEAYHASLRYLCYIQVSQLFQQEDKSQHAAITTFMQLKDNQHTSFDYLNLLLITTDILRDKQPFMPEINGFVDEFSNIETDLYRTALFLDSQREKLIKKGIPEDERLPGLLDEYLTALVYWLRKLSFVCKYRLVSIKDINLNYRMGSPKSFVHVYGELHGMYNEAFSAGEDYSAIAINDVFTYNQSVLLFRGNNVAAGLDNIRVPGSYLSLSPLVIDQSVFAEKSTQTPEIYYYTGHDIVSRQYSFAQYKNELPVGDTEKLSSNKEIKVKEQNIQQPKLDELFEQLNKVFEPFKNQGR